MATDVTPATGRTVVTDVPKRRGFAIPEAGALFLFLAAELVFFGIKSPYFFERENWFNILTAIAIYGVLAAPATLLLVAGQFDLSVGSGVAFTAVMIAYISGGQPPSLNHSILLGIVLAVACGLGIGIVNGFFVTVVGVNALITTLGMLAVLRGLQLVIAHGQTLLLTGFSGIGTARPFFNIPVPVLIVVVVIAIFWFIMRYTVYGRSMYAIGSNPIAARLTGIRS